MASGEWYKRLTTAAKERDAAELKAVTLLEGSSGWWTNDGRQLGTELLQRQIIADVLRMENVITYYIYYLPWQPLPAFCYLNLLLFSVSLQFFESHCRPLGTALLLLEK